MYYGQLTAPEPTVLWTEGIRYDLHGITKVIPGSTGLGYAYIKDNVV